MMTIEGLEGGDDGLAAEYALRLLSGDELEKARRRVGQDPEFARLVRDWEMGLASFTEELVPERPRASVKKSLEGRLFGAPASVPFWKKTWAWQAVAALSLLIAAFVVASDFTGGPSNERGQLFAAEIVSDTGDFRVVAVVDKSANEVFLTRTAGEIPEGRILQVWTHGPDEPAYSVGLWPEGENIRLPMSERMQSIAGVLTLGVSEEPPGGSPTGSPSGRVFGTVDIHGVSATL